MRLSLLPGRSFGDGGSNDAYYLVIESRLMHTQLSDRDTAMRQGERCIKPRAHRAIQSVFGIANGEQLTRFLGFGGWHDEWWVWRESNPHPLD